MLDERLLDLPITSDLPGAVHLLAHESCIYHGSREGVSRSCIAYRKDLWRRCPTLPCNELTSTYTSCRAACGPPVEAAGDHHYDFEAEIASRYNPKQQTSRLVNSTCWVDISQEHAC